MRIRQRKASRRKEVVSRQRAVGSQEQAKGRGEDLETFLAAFPYLQRPFSPAGFFNWRKSVTMTA
jgi:hypothetical protein